MHHQDQGQGGPAHQGSDLDDTHGHSLNMSEDDDGSYSGSSYSGSIDGTSPAVIAQVSELLNFVYGKTSVPAQIDRVSTIMRAYEGREVVLLELLETKALIKANSGGETMPGDTGGEVGMDGLPTSGEDMINPANNAAERNGAQEGGIPVSLGPNKTALVSPVAPSSGNINRNIILNHDAPDDISSVSGNSSARFGTHTAGGHVGVAQAAVAAAKENVRNLSVQNNGGGRDVNFQANFDKMSAPSVKPSTPTNSGIGIGSAGVRASPRDNPFHSSQPVQRTPRMGQGMAQQSPGNMSQQSGNFFPPHGVSSRGSFSSAQGTPSSGKKKGLFRGIFGKKKDKSGLLEGSGLSRDDSSI